MLGRRSGWSRTPDSYEPAAAGISWAISQMCPIGIGEGGGAHPPGAVHRAVEQRDAARRQVGAHGVRVGHPDRELEARPSVAGGDRRGSDERRRFGDREQVDDHVVEPERRGLPVLEDHRHAEDVLVERLRPLRVLDEEGDGPHALQ